MFCTASKLNKGHLRQDKITRGVLRGIKQSLNKGVGNLLRIFYELRKDWTQKKLVKLKDIF